ncbi:MAG: HPP family protein [Sulfuricella sp.]|nr:HPP family protein [Sulfuricella sp.]
MKDLFRQLFARQLSVTHRERLISAAGALVVMLLIGWLSHLLLGGHKMPFLAASMGASAILLLAVPHSPFSQPWPLLGGQVIPALIGIACAQLVPDLYVACALAVGLSIIAMFYLRCLHPPGGGTALQMVLGGPALLALGYPVLLAPVLLNSILLLIAALLINKLIPGRRYPVLPALHPAKPAVAPASPVKLNVGQEDILAAMQEIGAVIDVAEEDLERIFGLATLHAQRRKMGEVRCADIMTRDVATVERHTTQESAWNVLRSRNIRGVPVLDSERRVVGIVAIADFLKQADWKLCTLPQQLKMWLRGKRSPLVEEIMTSPVISVAENLHVVDLFMIFAEKRINHLPVVDEENRLTGIVTRLDLLSTLVGDYAEKG